jgi:hypothetical protein
MIKVGQTVSKDGVTLDISPILSLITMFLHHDMHNRYACNGGQCYLSKSTHVYESCCKKGSSLPRTDGEEK